ncbi:glucose PTS transporter subunit IIA [Clostridium oceanicum]|uniref:Glucose PTS transporter subunit IIA n=1 Tax=Clostridium oceanicum TaxID=1543 RepID=A0ABP3V575_9CLOT
MKKFFSKLQMIGRALMLPVSVLPAAGILLRLGYPDLLNNQYILKAGDSIFANLPMIFAVGVAIGLSKGEGAAALAAVVGEFMLEGIFKVASSNIVSDMAGRAARAKNMPMDVFMKTDAYKSILSNYELTMGVFGGILIGFIAAVLYNRYNNIKLPQIVGFFGGKRFVILLTSVVSLAIGGIAVHIWPAIQVQINILAYKASESILGPAFYAAGKRALIPLGLHHMYYPVFLYQFGNFVDSSGVQYFGDFARYFHGDPTAGVFMASEFPILMFGLPGAALAITLAAKSKNRKKVAGIMLSASLVAFFTGITEPIEFAFIFVAPVLFLFHVAAAFTSGIVTSVLNIRLGYTFSASFIDYILGYKFSENGILMIFVGIAYFFLYFLVFYLVIRYKNIKTIGREDEDQYREVKKVNKTDIAEIILESIGGKSNIVNLDSCITRLRIELKDKSKFNKELLNNSERNLGILETADIIQIILGTDAENIKNKIDTILKKDLYKDERLPYMNESYENIKDRGNKILVSNPIRGEIIPLEKVPDEVFAEKMLGEGFAIKPKSGKVYSPINGKVKFLFPSNHAIAIETEEGLEFLIHVGIDTVKLDGKGFEALVNKGDDIKRNQLILKFNMKFIKEKGLSVLSPVIVTNLDDFSRIKIKFGYKREKEVVALIDES